MKIRTPSPPLVNEAFLTAPRVQYLRDSLQIVMRRHIFSPALFVRSLDQYIRMQDVPQPALQNLLSTLKTLVSIPTPASFSVPIPGGTQPFRTAFGWMVANQTAVLPEKTDNLNYRAVLGTFAAGTFLYEFSREVFEVILCEA